MRPSRLLSLLTFTLTFGCAGAAAAAPAQPNIVMIAIDDMNDWIGAYAGPADTPNIDRLAASGLLFTNAHCVVPACNPSRVALMTGLRPETTGQYENAGNFREGRDGANAALLTLPQRLQQLGYVTAAAGKIFHHPRGQAAEPRPLSDPVSWNFQARAGTGTGGAQAYLDDHGWAKWLHGDRRDIKNDYGLRSPLWGPTPETRDETWDWKNAGFVADFILSQHDRPFFVAAGIFRPHAPLIAPQEYFDRYPLDQVELPLCPPDDMDDIPAIAQENWSTPLVHAMREEGQWRRAVQAYLACMSYADDCVGRILDAIDRSPQRDNTIVVFWTDHGWQLGHKNRWEKFSLWRQGTRTPLVVRAPGVDPATCDRAVSLLDVTPTVLSLVGAPVPAELQGVNLVPWLLNPALPRETPAVVTYLPGNHSVVQDQWNYIRYSDGSEELYDHTADPAEFTNLIDRPESAAIVDRLRPWLPATPGADFTRNKSLGGTE